MKNLALAALALAGAGLAATPAHAVLQFSANIGGTTFSCVDNAACDTNPLVGTITTGTQTFGAVTFLGSAQTQTTGASNTLDTTSFQITNSGAAAVAVTIAVGGTSFVGPVTSLSESGSGTWQNAAGSTIDLTYYADNANTQGANTPTDHPGILQADSGLFTAAGLTDSFNFNHVSGFIDPDLYSMTLETTGTIAGAVGGVASQLTGRSQAIVATAVPEPGTLGLLGAGLIGLGLVGWKRRHGGFAA
jgi:hypothetical protein